MKTFKYKITQSKFKEAKALIEENDGEVYANSVEIRKILDYKKSYNKV